MTWSRGSQGLYVLIFITHISAQAHPAPGLPCRDWADSRWAGRVMGLPDPSWLPVPLPKHPPSQGTPVTDFRLYVAAFQWLRPPGG